MIGKNISPVFNENNPQASPVEIPSAMLKAEERPSSPLRRFRAG